MLIELNTTLYVAIKLQVPKMPKVY